MRKNFSVYSILNLLTSPPSTSSSLFFSGNNAAAMNFENNGSAVWLNSRKAHLSGRSRAHVEAFEAKLLAKNPDAVVI